MCDALYNLGCVHTEIFRTIIREILISFLFGIRVTFTFTADKPVEQGSSTVTLQWLIIRGHKEAGREYSTVRISRLARGGGGGRLIQESTYASYGTVDLF